MAKILLVDDEPCILDVLERLLQRESFETATAGQAEEALACLREQSVDLMIADLRLGEGMDGIELMHAAHRLHPELPVIGPLTVNVVPELATLITPAVASEAMENPLVVEAVPPV